MGQVMYEEGGWALEIRSFKRLPSTQKRLIEDLKAKIVHPPIAYYTHDQYAGVGSRGNEWIGDRGNLFFSFALALDMLPLDLPLQSLAIYFSYALKMELQKRGSKVWLKWPNDFYIGTEKCGGCVTTLVDKVVVCGIGINTSTAPQNFAKLDIDVDHLELLGGYFELLDRKISWKEIFSNFRIEFQKSKRFSVHIGTQRVSLANAELADDGALQIGQERVYSVR